MCIGSFTREDENETEHPSQQSASQMQRRRGCLRAGPPLLRSSRPSHLLRVVVVVYKEENCCGATLGSLLRLLHNIRGKTAVFLSSLSPSLSQLEFNSHLRQTRGLSHTLIDFNLKWAAHALSDNLRQRGGRSHLSTMKTSSEYCCKTCKQLNRLDDTCLCSNGALMDNLHVINPLAMRCCCMDTMHHASIPGSALHAQELDCHPLMQYPFVAITL
jgi:hypothetical protein